MATRYVHTVQQCAYVCPHAAIRPFLIDEDEMANAPEGLQTIKPTGRGMDNLRYKKYRCRR